MPQLDLGRVTRRRCRLAELGARRGSDTAGGFELRVRVEFRVGGRDNLYDRRNRLQPSQNTKSLRGPVGASSIVRKRRSRELFGDARLIEIGPGEIARFQSSLDIRDQRDRLFNFALGDLLLGCS